MLSLPFKKIISFFNLEHSASFSFSFFNTFSSVMLEKKAEILNSNITLEKVLKKLKEKEAECSRLKNEIIFLKGKLNT